MKPANLLQRRTGLWLLVGFAFLAAVGIGVTVWSVSRLDEELLGRAAGNTLSTVLDRPVAVSRARVSLGGDFDLEGVQFGSAPLDIGPPPPSFSMEAVRGRVHWQALSPLGLRLERLAVEGLSIRGQDDGGAPQPEAGESPLGAIFGSLVDSLSLESEQMTVSGTTIGYRNRPTPWEVRGDNVVLAFGVARGGGFEGEIRSGLGVLRFWDVPDYPMEMAAKFRIEGNLLHVDQLVLGSDFLEGELSGTLDLADDLSGPLKMTAEAEAGTLSRFFFDHEALDTAGFPRMRFDGSAYFADVGFVMAGDFVLPGGAYYGIPFEDWSGALHWDPERVEILSSEGVAAGGPATFRLRQVQPREENPAAIGLTMRDASLGAAASGLFGTPTPLRSRFSLEADVLMPLAEPTALVGGISAAGTMPERAGGTFPVAGAGLPLGFEVELDISTPGVFVETLVVEGAAYRAEARGAIPYGDAADVRFSGLAGDVAGADAAQQELRRLLFDELPEDTFFDVAGGAGAEGVIRGVWPDLILEGEIEGRDFRYAAIEAETLVAQGTVSATESRLDSLTARKGEATLTSSGVFARGDEEFPDMEFTAAWSLWDAREIVEYLEWDLEAEGIVSGRARTVRRNEAYTGDGIVRGANGSVLEQPFDEVEVAWTMDGEKAWLRPMRGSFRGGTAAGELSIGLWEWEMEGRITGQDFPLTPGLAPEWLSLRSDFELDVAGDLLVPELLLNARVPDGGVLGLSLGSGSLVGEVHGERFEARGGLDSGAITFEMTGVTPLGVGGSGTVIVHEGVDISPLLSGATGGDFAVIAHGRGDFHIEDPLDEWMEGTVVIEGLTMTGPGLDARLAEPARLRIDEARVHIEELELEQGESRLSLAGSLGLDDLLVDFDLTGRAELSTVSSLTPGLAAEGALDVDARIVGLATEPEFVGTGVVQEGMFRIAGFPHALIDVEGSVAFDHRTVRIAEVAARFAGGDAVIAGSIALDDAAVGAVDLLFQLADARIRYPDDLAATVAADLRLVGDQGGRLLSGTVELDEAIWSREYELFANVLADVNSVSSPRDPAEYQFLDQLRMDIQVTTDSPFLVRNPIFQLDAAADFNLRGAASAPALLGSAELVGGEMYFGAYRFQVTSGRAEFIDPSGIEPVLDLEAETLVRNYRVRLTASGTPEHIEAVFSSDPPLGQADIFRLLSGASDEALLTAAADDNVAAASAASLLSQQLTNMIGQRAGRVFGIDRVSVDPFLIGRFSNPTARVTLAKQWSPDLNVRYSSSFSSAEDSIIVVEYTPQGPVSWIFSRDRDGSLGVDVRFHRAF